MGVSKTKLAATFALTSAVSWSVCSAFFAVFPDFANRIMSWILHGMTINATANIHITWANYFGGGLALAIYLGIIGYIAGLMLAFFKPFSK